MNRGPLVVLFIVVSSSTAACGGFLPFVGDDDDTETPPAPPSAADASGDGTSGDATPDVPFVLVDTGISLEDSSTTCVQPASCIAGSECCGGRFCVQAKCCINDGPSSSVAECCSKAWDLCVGSQAGQCCTSLF